MYLSFITNQKLTCSSLTQIIILRFKFFSSGAAKMKRDVANKTILYTRLYYFEWN